MNSFLLTLLDGFRWLFRLLNVDYDQLRAIVGIKLTIDNRRQVIAYRRNNTEEPENTFLWTAFFYGLFGIFIAFALYGIPSLMVSMIMFFSYIMVMISMTLITDFSAILLDTSDNTIILPRPVHSRTLFVARITHILLYLGILTVGLSAAPALVIFIKFDLVLLLLFLIGIILSVITAVVITNALYLVIMHFASEEKLKNVINFFQIVMAVAIMGGYQLLPRAMGRFDLEDADFKISWWTYLTPPAWMAGALEAWHLKIADTPHIIFTLCALVVPLAGFYMVNRYLTPVFTRKLGIIATTTDTPEKKTKAGKTGFLQRISYQITSNTIERSSFELIYKILGRDRKIKLKIYPSFGYVLVFGLIFIMRSREDLLTTFRHLPSTEYHLLLIYLTFMILQVAFYELPYSDDFKASWVYFSSPIDRPGDVLLGMLKAIFVRLFIPGYLILSALVLIIWGIPALDDVVFGFFNNFLMLLLIAIVGKKSLPLSMEPSVRNQAGSFIRSLMMLILLGGLGTTHYLLTKKPLILLAAIPVQIIAIYFLVRSYRKTTWGQLTV